jgi:hypothetical protein
MKKLLLPILVVVVALLSSCIGIESQITLQNDGSGTLLLNYRVSRLMKNLDVAKSDWHLPLPVSREDFQRTVDSISGLKLLSLAQREDERDVLIDARLAFTGVQAINSLGKEGQIELSLSNEGDLHVFRQQIYRGRGLEQISPESLQMIQTFFEGYELSYRVTAPAAIKRHSLGELSPDQRSVIYKTSVADLLKSGEKQVLEVDW